jgi:hypothetical protein
MKIEDIKEYCIQVDLDNVLSGDEKDIRLFYYKIGLVELLQVFSQYNGLTCYRADEPEDYRKAYNIDILEIIEHL